MSAKRQEAQNTKKIKQNYNLAVCRAGNFSTESKSDSLSTKEVGNGLDEKEDDDDDDDGEDDGDDIYIMMKCVFVCLSRKMSTSSWEALVIT